ncbi:MAG: type II secretion system F family protein [Nanoarchaeota archaeon]
MALRIIFLEEFGKAFVPKRMIPNLRKYFLKAGYEEVPYRFFGMLFYISAAITALIFILIIYPFIKELSPFKTYLYSFFGWFAVQILFTTFFSLIVYFYLDLKIYRRTRNMEDELPDFLQILSSNLKGGMTFERALWASIKPRFAVLGTEMARTSKKVITGYELDKALFELADKYDSLMLRRTVDLMISEAESGGNVANLIDRIVDNLKETKTLKEEMSASAIAYIIFISMIVVVIGPLLFALSFHLLSIFIGFIEKIATSSPSATGLPFSFSKTNVDTGDFRTFSVITIGVISFFASMIVAIVEKGNIKSGVKYIPIFLLGSMASYFLFVNLLSIFFSGII